MQHSEGDSDDDSEPPESSPATARSAISRETSPPVGCSWVGSGVVPCRGGRAVQSASARSLHAVLWVSHSLTRLHRLPAHLCCAVQAKALQQQLPPDMKAGWLEKRSGDSSSLNALPVDSWKWQKRWWVWAAAALAV